MPQGVKKAFPAFFLVLLGLISQQVCMLYCGKIAVPNSDLTAITKVSNSLAFSNYSLDNNMLFEPLFAEELEEEDFRWLAQQCYFENQLIYLLNCLDEELLKTPFVIAQQYKNYRIPFEFLDESYIVHRSLII